MNILKPGRFAPQKLVMAAVLALSLNETVRGAGHDLEADSSNRFIAGNDVTWTTLGTNENDSMPIGNGDIAANVWTEQNGDLVLLVAKADAWAETGALLKLGRVRVQLNPNPFAGAVNFSQVLKLESGSIGLKSGEDTLRVWMDANHPAIHVEAHLEHPG